MKVCMREPEDCQRNTSKVMSMHASARGSYRALLRGEACRISRPRCKQFLGPLAGLAAFHHVVHFLVSQAKIHRRPGCCPDSQATTLMDFNSCKFCERASFVYCRKLARANEGRKAHSERFIGMRRICSLRYGRVFCRSPDKYFIGIP